MTTDSYETTCEVTGTETTVEREPDGRWRCLACDAAWMHREIVIADDGSILIVATDGP